VGEEEEGGIGQLVKWSQGYARSIAEDLRRTGEGFSNPFSKIPISSSRLR